MLLIGENDMTKTTHWIWCDDPLHGEVPEIPVSGSKLFWISLKYTPHRSLHDDLDTDLYYALSIEDYKHITA